MIEVPPSARRADEDPFSRVYRAIRQALSAGLFQPGDQIVVTDLARRLGVSPTPVREALSRLVGERLVDDRRRHGYFVPLPAAFDLLELYEILEMFAVSAVLDARRYHPRLADDWRIAGSGRDPVAGQLGSILRLSRNRRVALAGSLVLDCLTPALRMEIELYPGADAFDALDARVREAAWQEAMRLLRRQFRVHRSRAGQVAHALGAAHRARNSADIV